ncbi:MFS transporter [Brevibacillus sp. SYP-B805]|uniref:MFS transporter n=1 Tax=Brevibacillus sp. SYP-B805 TaxID=1578199 RepID=UPI0013EBCB25|nr:MFS transporter [Brevibacillus sp. SYP-B805]NGQ96995.1 MFS transporter [Brevibacillus sp. SYP-B805]
MDRLASNGEVDYKAGKGSGGRAVAAASIGNALEWYDFSVYAFFAVYISENFFVNSDSTVQLLNAFLVFALGFVVRPLGALVMGVYGDKAGRKAALTLTILTMAAGTLIIAVAPTYSAIGVAAPLLIVLGRILQGFSAGGEFGSAAAFLVEHAPENKKGRYASWLQASMAISNILGALVGTLVTLLLTREQVGDWGWRIPFIFGLLIAPVGLYLRKTLDETPHFQQEVERGRQEAEQKKTPLLQVIREHPRELLIGTSLSILWVVCVYSLIIFMPTYVQKTLHFDSSQAFLASLIGNIFMVVGCVFSGTLSDIFGRRRVLALSALFMLVGVYPLLGWVEASHSTVTLVVVQTVFCLMVAMFVGVAPSALSEIFPTRVRSTGMSLSYNIAVTIFGGFAPAILTWLTQNTGNTFAPAWYVMAGAVITLVAVIFLPHHRRSLATTA